MDVWPLSQLSRLTSWAITGRDGIRWLGPCDWHSIGFLVLLVADGWNLPNLSLPLAVQPCWHISQCQRTECGLQPRNNVLLNTNTSVCVCVCVGSSLLFPYRLINKRKTETERVNLTWPPASAIAAVFWCLWNFCLDGNGLLHKCFSEWLQERESKHQRWWYTRTIKANSSYCFNESFENPWSSVLKSVTFSNALCYSF